MVARLTALVAFGLLIFSWTNPSTNTDGSACHDLAVIRFKIRQAIVGGPVYTNDLMLPAGHEGLRDSVRFAFPCASSGYSWWFVTCFPVDTAGNVGDSSNSIAVCAPNP